MSTWVGVEIDGLNVEAYQNHHSTWFFKRSDRVREGCTPDEHGRLPCTAFIGFRASVATIRRRMSLAGFDLEACEQHFNENLPIVVEAAKCNFRHFQDEPGAFSPVSLRLQDAYRMFTDAIKETSLQDWLDVLPEALKVSKSIKHSFSQTANWRNVSAIPLVNAMLSDIPLYTEYSHTDQFNFPCIQPTYFQIAWLAGCPDDAVCELNIAPLIHSGWEEDFQDLDEIQRHETKPHSFCRQSIEETVALSSTQSENLHLQRMCYSSIITAMEAYFGDILRREIFERPAVKERFVASYKAFDERKLKLSDIFTRLRKIDSEISTVLDELSLHKIETAKNIFASTLLTEFPPESIPYLGAAVKLRHDIVHRNGRDTKGSVIGVGQKAVDELARQVLSFTQAVDRQIIDGLLREHEAG
ncbi:HEPN/Toprim-associated domain-containing protein [Pantoea endophytica]